MEMGNIPGTVTVVVTATPTSRYESLFNSATEYTDYTESEHGKLVLFLGRRVDYLCLGIDGNAKKS